MLTVTDLTVSYGPIAAVKSISFEVNQGELVTLLGANGAGKSSTLNAIMGLAPITGGTIHFKDQQLNSMPVEKRHPLGIGFSPEGRRVFGPLTVRDNLIAGGNELSGHDLENRIDQVIQRFPVLDERMQQMAGTLSGGEQQMLAIARALMHEPEFLILDEPSLGLAPKIVSEVFDLISALHSEGTTILLVEQNIRKSLAIAERACVMELGEITQTGDAKVMRKDPRILEAYLGQD
ncbi:MAG: ABC transporter ATP-binding protein [Rhodobacteraceae bacterium]|nr:ABC transporter ATP-binding protein [Paracoccaceae bacterium]